MYLCCFVFLLTGAGGLDPGVVAHAILRGVNTSTSPRKLQCLTIIRLVLIKINVFLEFKKQAVQMFPHAVVNTGNEKSALTPRLPSFWVVWQKLLFIASAAFCCVSVSGSCCTTTSSSTCCQRRPKCPPYQF